MTEKTVRESILEICLCPRCASVFYNDRAYWIERYDPNQVILEDCMLCARPHAYMFRILKKSSMQSTANLQNRTLAKGGRNE